MATLSLEMMHDHASNNIYVSGINRDGVRAIQDALHAAVPNLFPDKVFTWEANEDAVAPTGGIFAWPTLSKWVTQKFGENEAIYRKFGMRNADGTPQIGHEGLDIGVAIGTDIYAIADGIVTSSKSQHTEDHRFNYGKHITIKHDNGYESKYAHLSQVLVLSGENVTRGQRIGLSGNTGNTTGPHLHVTVRLNRNYVDPLPLLP